MFQLGIVPCKASSAGVPHFSRTLRGVALLRIEKLRYMHRNPMKRGLVEQPDQWPRSSFRAYFFGEAGPVAVNQWDVLKLKIRAPAT